MISRLAGRQTPTYAAPLWLAFFGSYFNLFFCTLMRKTANLTPGAIKTLRWSHRISHEKASRELGYRPRPFEETLRDTLDWFRDHGMLEN
jgi:dihydroflavonol-4-reductase